MWKTINDNQWWGNRSPDSFSWKSSAIDSWDLARSKSWKSSALDFQKIKRALGSRKSKNQSERNIDTNKKTSQMRKEDVVKHQVGVWRFQCWPSEHSIETNKKTAPMRKHYVFFRIGTDRRPTLGSDYVDLSPKICMFAIVKQNRNQWVDSATAIWWCFAMSIAAIRTQHRNQQEESVNAKRNPVQHLPVYPLAHLLSTNWKSEVDIQRIASFLIQILGTCAWGGGGGVGPDP